MRFKFSDKFQIDTSEEPFKSEGLRVGVYANPGAGKSYTVALLAEQWLDQGGTLIVFAPRAEWHTLKSKYPVQVVGGPFLQDVPLVSSEPSLYAKVAIEQGVSLVFYTSDIEDEEKLVEFVTRFVGHIIKLQERHHRPLLLIVEETQEYAPRSPSGHIAPPWVYNRMIKALKDCFSQGRKLNICPVAISQRPQEVNFTIRQLANLVWFGGFSAQDVGYLDKEVFTHFRKNGVDVRAQDLLGVGRGEWLVIVGKTTSKVKVTEMRKTPHGADTPTLDYVQPVGEEVKRAVSALGEQLKAMLEKRAAEESELEKAKRQLREMAKEVEDLKGKMKLGQDLRTLLQQGDADDAEILGYQEALTKMEKTRDELQEENDRLKERVALLPSEEWGREAAEKLKQLEGEVEELRGKLTLSVEMRDAFRKFLDLDETPKYQETESSPTQAEFTKERKVVKLKGEVERVVQVDASRGWDGKMLQVMVEDLSGKLVTTGDIHGAMKERGWTIDTVDKKAWEKVRLILINMAKDGLVVKEGTKYRLPAKLAFEQTGDD